METYIFVDPSGSYNEGKGHTGIAIISNKDWNTLINQSIAANKYKNRHEYWHSIIEYIKTITRGTSNECTVIIESFMIRNQGFLIGKMPETIQFIGALVWELEKENIKYVFQTPSQAKSRFKDESLSRYIPNFELRSNGRYYLNGKQTNDHVRDALKHLLYFLKYNKEK